MTRKKTLWDIKRLLKERRQTTLEGTRHKGDYYLLHILKNGRPVPLFKSSRAQDVIDWIKSHH